MQHSWQLLTFFFTTKLFQGKINDNGAQATTLEVVGMIVSTTVFMHNLSPVISLIILIWIINSNK
jgi:hypothetical protein